MKKNNVIGVFDSGIGGVTVLKRLRELLPHEDFYYFADYANMPYGNKDPKQIASFTRDIITFMQDELQAKMVVSCCHTASGVALNSMVHEFKIPIISTINPTVQSVIQNPISRRVGVIATSASASSKVHERAIMGAGFSGYVCSIACSGLAELIEVYPDSGDRLKTLLAEYLVPFGEQNLDTLIYGCTHYPLIDNVIRPLLPDSIIYIDPAKYIAKQAVETLEKLDLAKITTELGRVDFYSSGVGKLGHKKRFCFLLNNQLV